MSLADVKDAENKAQEWKIEKSDIAKPKVLIIALKDYNPATSSTDSIVNDLRRRLPGKDIHGDSGKIFIMSMDFNGISQAIVEEVVRTAGYEYEVENIDGVQKTTISLSSLNQPVSPLHMKGTHPWWKFWA
jgi:hypothetical protein